MNAAPAFPDAKRLAVDAYLEKIDFEAVPQIDRLVEAMRYSLLAGGKRVRPVLALSTAHALGHDPSVVMPYAAALELIHTYSLIHDDLPAMDDDDLRRGKPTCHVAYGENVAILAGDALFAEALRLITADQGGDPMHVVGAMDELLSAIGAAGMVGGQFIDIDEQVEGAQELKLMHELKTGRLIRASVRGAAIVLGTPTSQVEQLGDFAGELGVLFQIIDDILDVTGSDAELGKPSGSDERHGKATYVSAFGLDGARKLADQSYARVRELLESVDFRGDAGDLQAVSAYIYGRDR
ncbi:MAG: polyprenyl synthetase family protein [Thermoleophilaceae bacterium]|nr:polyprenyl synthetase family protein [Thermoleophilaceae bacterium]